VAGRRPRAGRSRRPLLMLVKGSSPGVFDPPPDTLRSGRAYVGAAAAVAAGTLTLRALPRPAVEKLLRDL
jgi:hypothetical protein